MSFGDGRETGVRPTKCKAETKLAPSALTSVTWEQPLFQDGGQVLLSTAVEGLN